MPPLKIGISGVRGVVGETFTPELVAGFAQAFGTYFDSGRILVCRDTRPSGPMVAAAVFSGLLAAGCDVVDLGICPTPSMQLAVPRERAHGGISITAGHNPSHWNALKFVRGDGLYLNSTQAEELLDVFHQGEYSKADWQSIRTAVRHGDAITPHIDALVAHFDAAAIRARRFKVAVDCCNGACCLLTPRLLAALGCDVLAINDNPSMAFAHIPEPGIDAMAQVAAVVKAGRADIGFAHDSDGERLGLVDESGVPLSEELTLAVATEIMLRVRSASSPVVVTNVSTSSAVDRIAQRCGGKVIRTPVGQPYISEAMVEHHAVIGGEGNGSVAIPAVHPTHDSAAAMVFILEHLAKSRRPLSALVDELPDVVMVKEQLAVEPHLIHTALQAFRDGLMEVEGNGRVVENGDGVKVEWDDGWVHVRSSNTESLIRVIAEAASQDRARELIDWARDRLPV